MKLYLVTTKFSSSQYSDVHVVAENPGDAEETVLNYLENEKLGFSSERVVVNINLLSETGKYPTCKRMLFLQE